MEYSLLTHVAVIFSHKSFCYSDVVIKSLTPTNQVKAALSSVIMTQEYIICSTFGINKVKNRRWQCILF